MRIEGWEITGLCAGIMAGLIAVSLAVHGAGEQATREVIRWSARFGALVFSAAFAARPLHQLLGSPATRWLLRNRRHLGVGFAVMHFTHLAAIGVVAMLYPEPFRSELSPLTLWGGGAAYVLLAGMTITSFDRTANMISRRAWKILHTSGAYAVWGVLAFSYAGLTAEQGIRYAPLLIVLIAAWAVRVLARLAQRSRRAAHQPV